MADHFERVRERMKSGSTGSSWEDIPADSQNELTKDLKKGTRRG